MPRRTESSTILTPEETETFEFPHKKLETHLKRGGYQLTQQEMVEIESKWQTLMTGKNGIAPDVFLLQALYNVIENRQSIVQSNEIILPTPQSRRRSQ